MYNLAKSMTNVSKWQLFFYIQKLNKKWKLINYYDLILSIYSLFIPDYFCLAIVLVMVEALWPC